MAKFVNVKKISAISKEKENYNKDIEESINSGTELDESSISFKNIKKIEKSECVKSKKSKKNRKEKKIEKKKMKEIEEDLKTEKKKIQKGIPEIIPFLDIDDNEAFKTKNGFMDIYQISSYDISSMNIYETKNGILSFAKLLRVYKKNMKIVSMNFPTNTQIQKDYIKRKISKCKDQYRCEELKKEFQKLEAIERLRSDREYYIFIFAKDEEDLNNKRNSILKAGKNLGVNSVDIEKKIKIIYKLNNMNSKII